MRSFMRHLILSQNIKITVPNLTKKIQNTIFQHSLLEKDSKIVVAVSGGPDSVCLLDIFTNLQKKYPLKIVIAHVNYGLRRKDSQKDEIFVRTLAKEYGLKIFVLNPKIKSKFDLENTLRKIRYRFFEDTRKKNKFDLIAIAHNADDQVETFFLHLLRGSGLAGLASMKYKNEKIIRPLLGTWRKEILDYLKDNDLSYRIDKTNLENTFTRNRVRNQLIPILEKKFNPKIKSTIFDAIESISDDYSFLNEFSQKAYKKNGLLSVRKIFKNHPAIQKRIILEALKEKNPNLRNIESAHLREILKALRSTKNKRQIVIFKGLKMERKGDRIFIEKAPKRSKAS